MLSFEVPVESNPNNPRPFIGHSLGARPCAPRCRALSYLTVTAAPCGRDSDYPHSAEGKTEAQRQLSTREGHCQPLSCARAARPRAGHTVSAQRTVVSLVTVSFLPPCEGNADQILRQEKQSPS